MIKTYNQDEMYKIINSLDFYSRIWIGQYDKILWDARWHKNCTQLDHLENKFKKLFMKLRDICLPELRSYGWSGSHGIFSPDIDYRAGVAYDMQQVFRYTLAYFLHPEGGITVDFNKPMKAELDPYEFPKAKAYEKDGRVYVDIDICEEQFNVIENALAIDELKNKYDIKGIFEYYTANEQALEIADKITELFTTVDDERY